MSIDELRDYAVTLEQEKSANEQAMADKDKTITDLTADVVALQRRNNSLFMQVEQQGKQTPPPQQEPAGEGDDGKDKESIADFAKNNYKEYIG